MKLFSYISLLRKCNTLENKLETEVRNKKKDKEKIIELQDKYIATLEKTVDIDKLYKQLNTKINEVNMKGKK